MKWCFLVLICISLTNVLFSQDKFDVAVELKRMKVLYKGIDNPVKVLVASCEVKNLTPEIDNGIIVGNYGNYVIRPDSCGKAILTLKCKGIEVSKTEFLVKSVPELQLVFISDTFASNLGYQKKGLIKRKNIPELKSLKLFSFYSDFDWDFKIIKFSLSATIGNMYKSATSETDKITNEQKALINEISTGAYFYIENVVVRGPNGKIRQVGSQQYMLID